LVAVVVETTITLLVQPRVVLEVVVVPQALFKQMVALELQVKVTTVEP
jgi:hypothetical protein